MLVLVIWIMALAAAFYFIAQNQIDFDGLSEVEINDLKYKTADGAMWFIVDIVLGDIQKASFDAGTKPSQGWFLKTLFIITSFLMLIHLLNMLIAIMGDSFNNR